VTYAHRLVKRQAEVRRSTLKFLRPDAKSQLSFRYDEAGQPVGVDAVVLSTQHDPDISQETLREAVMEEIIKPVLPSNWISADTKILINPTGKFVIGGPVGDCGLTGRKIIVDTYGGAAPHGGGAFSGKDPTKVDRSAAYAARYLAKNVVSAGLADRCTIQIAYAIGVSQPLAVYVDLHGTGTVGEDQVEKALSRVMDLSPRGIREHLRLNRPIYARTAAYGHFGRPPERDGGFSWERTDLGEAIQAEL
jgi:S-adenosylmethionine synthetase